MDKVTWADPASTSGGFFIVQLCLLVLLSFLVAILLSFRVVYVYLVLLGGCLLCLTSFC